MRRKIHLVRDILEWTSKGLESNIACMQNMLFNRWKPPGCIVMSVPSHGTLQLQSNLSLSESQMRGLRGMLAGWGNNFLHGWRVVKRQRSGLTFPLSARLQQLEVDKDGTKDAVLVVSMASVRTWLEMKVTLLTRHKVLIWPSFIPKDHLYIVVQLDLGQGSTKMSLRLLNVPHARSPQNLDPLCIFEAPEQFGNLRDTCSTLFREIMALHQTWWLHLETWYFLVFFSSNDHKMTSTLYAHAGQSAKFFNAYDYTTLDRLVKGKIPGGWIMKKYVAFVFDPIRRLTFRRGLPILLCNGNAHRCER